MNSLRSALYLAARLIGDINAISRGPSAILARIARKTVWRLFAKIIN